ncbi:autophagy-related protein 2 [Aspergillus bombycis]|uniref:Autophagy-related protein 2 n=1 Tax=Aspergillus bombycis TaxID=109264 RepID=A0A1F8AEH4_9EURO|nr:autophagy-related protein 2 [Aspergillus bombycis]OGM50130.1 autophagy-related protein 2 [Aspergillus bombycis]
MAYFLPSFFQKRLLRYALSRLELVDTDALDLDSLGIRWGQRSTVELRDIGLRLEKLATLLHLPPSSELLSARVQFLKLTVPADIYSSSIICEASGIDVHLRLPLEETRAETHDATTDPKASGRVGFGSGDEPILPNPTDLAESFLQAEPKEEKEELQAAISSQSQILQHTSTSSSDDEEELGLGNETVSLPSFVAAFLKGVVDRLQVQVDDISIRVDVETKQEGSSKRHPEEKPDLITGLLSVRQVSMGAVSTHSESSEASSSEGKRLVSLADINLALISEPVVFSNYSRFAAPASPSTPVHPKPSQPPSRAQSPSPETSSESSLALAMTRSTIFEPPQDLTIPEIGEQNTPRMEGSVYTYDGRFSDADTEDETRSYGSLGDSRQFEDDEKLLDNPAYLDSVIDYQFHHDDPGRLGDLQTRGDELFPRSGDTPRPQSPEHTTEPSDRNSHPEGALITLDDRHELEVAKLPSRQRYLEAPEPIAEPGSSGLPPEEDLHFGYTQQLPLVCAPSSEHYSSGSASESLKEAELSESKLFSNEEAQSMYMSAISQGSTSHSFMPNMPGAWDSPESTYVRDTAFHETPTAMEQDTHGEQDEAVTTPKLTAREEMYLSQARSIDNLQKTQTGTSDRESIHTSPGFNRLTDVVKRFVSVDKVLIWIPSVNREDKPPGDSQPTPHQEMPSDGLKDSTAYLQDSVVDDDLLASRIHNFPDPRSGTNDPSSPHEGVDHKASSSQEKIGYDAGVSREHDEVTAEIHSAEVQFDIAIGWLVFKIGQRIVDAFGHSDGESPKKHSPESNAQAQAQNSFGLILNKFSVKFVEHVPGHANPFGESRQYSPTFFGLMHEDIVLQTTASGMKAHFSSVNDQMKLRLDITKFTLGVASEDLISFNQDLKMRESMRDVLSPTHGDISLSMSKSLESARIHITTLPLHLNLNIQRLEEVVGWIGGLSTILELGSSISSASGTKAPKKDPPKRPRGVHFEAPPSPEKLPRNTSLPWKVNARVGGVALNVVGESHYLKLRTTAVKVVSRFEGVGVQIDKAKLSGPLPLDDSKDAPAKINLSNIRVEYLFAPKEVDLDRLLSLITPSKDKYDEDDDIMLDTLFRQRRQGSVLRTTIAGANITISRTTDFDSLPQLGDELGRLSNVAKYLPEDDRPGLLTLNLIRDFEVQLPSLVAAQVGSAMVLRNGTEELLGEALPLSAEQRSGQIPHPMLMARFIADEMEPTIKVKMHNLRAEYTVPAAIAFLGLNESSTTGDVAANMAQSLGNLAELQPSKDSKPAIQPESPKAPVRPTRLALALRDCVIGLNPRGSEAKGLVVLTNANFSGAMGDEASSEATLDLRKASIMIIDDARNMGNTDDPHRRNSTSPPSSQVQSFIDMGFVTVSTISSATASVKLLRSSEDGTQSLDVELRDDLLILETCADSTQTLISIVNGLQPPTPPSVTKKYRTEVLPLQDMLASFSGDAFALDSRSGPEGSSETAGDSAEDFQDKEGHIEDEVEYVSDFYPAKPTSGAGSLHEAMTASGSNELLDSFHSQYYVSSSISDLEFRDDHFAAQSAVGGTAHRWDSAENTYGLSDDTKLQKSPLRIRVRDAHVIWNLFDGCGEKGYGPASKGESTSPSFDEDEESVIGDCLFNSIYIGIPANKDPRELRSDINRNIDDLVSETGSYATTTTVTGATVRQSQSPSFRKKLRLSRSKYHKMTFELKGICADLVVFPPDSGETQSSLDVRVNDLEIFDHVPTSTWKKFATYMHEVGEKESGTSMVHLEILTVRPVPELAASEIVLKATLLPLRLHVDQDALDFLCRFFEFRDDSAPAPSAPQDIPFLQRVEINAVPVRLDFKPKRVDYNGLRSGRTTEFMNFFVLDGADMVMRHVIIYGVSGFDKLGQTLNDIWMPDIKRNQLPGVLAGLAPIRSLVNVGGGVKDLVVVPMREYRKDGRIVRSIQKGALAFAKTTSNELVKLGAKLAIGTQTVLQGAEDLLTSPNAQLASAEEDVADEEEAKKISLYADQPVGVVQGLRGAFRGLERDLLLTRDAIVAVPGEVVESGSAKAAAKAVWKRAPTVILRPAIGVSKAVGQTLLGAGNTLDPSNRRKMEDKYKRH